MTECLNVFHHFWLSSRGWKSYLSTSNVSCGQETLPEGQLFLQFQVKLNVILWIKIASVLWSNSYEVSLWPFLLSLTMHRKLSGMMWCNVHFCGRFWKVVYSWLFSCLSLFNILIFWYIYELKNLNTRNKIFSGTSLEGNK